MVDILDKLMKSTRTRTIGIRLPIPIYLLYNSLELTKDDLAELKQLISAFIISKAVEKGIEIPEDLKKPFQNIFGKSSTNGNIIFNINISNAKSEAKVNIDISKLTQILNELESLLTTIQKNNWRKESNAYIIPPARWKELNEKVDSLKKLVN